MSVSDAESGPTGRLLNIQRMSTEDGPGLRTTVFFKGCSLACSWCHNPESIRLQQEAVWHDWKCMGCSTCVEVCPHTAITAAADGVTTDGDKCALCGTCVDECPTTARELIGTGWTVEALVAEVVKDRAYFESSGGITMSGGEPMLQSRFAAAFAARCRQAGLHVAVDTCGMCSEEILLRVVEQVDMVLYDLKTIDPVEHARHTGHENQRILENLVALRDYMVSHDNPSRLWIRTPLIPEATATDANISAIGGFIAEHVGDVVDRWELGAFNNLCIDKYKRLGITWRFASCEAMTAEELTRYEGVARESGVDPEIVHANGPTRVGDPSPDESRTASGAQLRESERRR
jgi:pyruvate formate lyase activating enzyme